MKYISVYAKETGKRITSFVVGVHGNTIEEVKEVADEENDYGTSALVDEYISTYEKDLWMLNAYLK